MTEEKFKELHAALMVDLDKFNADLESYKKKIQDDLAGAYTQAMINVYNANRRDQFAMAALTGLLTEHLTKLEQGPLISNEQLARGAAHLAYVVADEMVKAREAKF